jgi:hypothetical protein
MRGLFIGLLLWLSALFLFFFVLGGMGLFGRSAGESSMKRAAGEPVADLSSADPFAGKDPGEVEAQVDSTHRDEEFRRWAQQGPNRNVHRPTTPRGTSPRPMMDVRPY